VPSSYRITNICKAHNVSNLNPSIHVQAVPFVCTCSTVTVSARLHHTSKINVAPKTEKFGLRSDSVHDAMFAKNTIFDHSMSAHLEAQHDFLAKIVSLESVCV